MKKPDMCLFVLLVKPCLNNRPLVKAINKIVLETRTLQTNKKKTIEFLYKLNKEQLF